MAKIISLKKAVLAFRASAVEACRHPRQAVEKFGINIASLVYFMGSCLQGQQGAVTATGNDIAAGILNGTTSLVALGVGHKTWGIALSFVLGAPAVALVRWDGVSALNPQDLLVVGAYVFGQALFVVSKPLIEKFKESSEVILRQTLGNPRRLAAATMICCVQLPCFFDRLAQGKPEEAFPFLVFSGAHVFSAFSKPSNMEAASLSKPVRITQKLRLRL